uniref:Uncharacterized protein n=1 Tax=Arundo donax TaxID=35708 RepID=A0A0A9D660_ARUDO
MKKKLVTNSCQLEKSTLGKAKDMTQISDQLIKILQDILLKIDPTKHPIKSDLTRHKKEKKSFLFILNRVQIRMHIKQGCLEIIKQGCLEI